MIITSDMWLAPKIAAMKEVAEFDPRYAQKLYGPMLSGVSPQGMALRWPLSADQARHRQEGRRGRQDRRHAHPDHDDDESVKSPDSSPRKQTAGQDEKLSSPRSVGGLLGGLAQKATKKKRKAGRKRRYDFPVHDA